MASSGSHKRRTAAGVGLATSILLSPHNPEHTAIMGFDKFFTRPSSSSSSNNSSRPQGGHRPPASPEKSKADYAYGLHSSNPPCDDDAPPAYSPKKDADYNDWATDSKISEPEKPYDYAAYISTLGPIGATTNSQGEDPLRQLKYYDIVIILDDSWSMTETDKGATKRRWDQVSNNSLPPLHARYRRGRR